MIRRILLAAILLAAGGRYAYGATCLPFGSGPVINGFETAAPCTVDFTDWTFTSVPAGGTWAAANTATSLAPIQGSEFGWAAGDVTQMSLTLTTAACPALASNNDWTAPAYNYIFVGYYSTTTTADEFHFEYQFINSASVNPVGFQTSGDLVGSVTPTWSYVITSLNYARNIGYATSDITQVRLVDFGPVFNTNLGIAYDQLQLDPTTGTLDTPNVAVPPGQISGTPSGCGTSFKVTWTDPAQSGTDAISGYHIYRSTVGPTGPWVSDGYAVGAGSTSFTDNTAGMSSTQYYIVLPYSSTTTAFNGVAGVFTGCNVVSLDEPWTTADGGVNEALIANADAAGPFNAVAGCSPTDTPTDTPTFTPSSTATDTSTSSPTASATPTFTETSTSSATASATPTSSSTFTLTNTPTITNTPPPGSTNTFTPSITPTATNTSTATPTFTASNTPAAPTATFTASNTFTPGPPTPTPTPVVTQPYVQLYPNPFYPDRGQVSHLGPVPAGETWSVFDIIGKFVYKATTTGNPALDIWYGYNADGMECSTGIYFLVIHGKVYRIGLVRN